MCELLRADFEEVGGVQRGEQDVADGLYLQGAQQGEPSFEEVAVRLRYGACRLGDMLLLFVEPDKHHQMIL